MSSNQALAVKYRPRRFGDLAGNPTVRTILQNSVAQDRFRNAYLLAGNRGSGKTTAARIFAKAINCTGRARGTSEPCLVCESCKDVDREIAMGDVNEVDAATNNTVDAMRVLVRNIQFPPAFSNKRVVILDESHMLSSAAGASLLKTVEEPPPHVVFIFCTTDPQKMLDTIRSRSMQFEFQKLTANDIADRLLWIAEQEKIRVTREAATLIGSVVNGAVRDAVTILDQASLLSEVVTIDTVALIVGYVSTNDMYTLMAAVHSGDSRAALEWVDKMADKLDGDIATSTLHFLETLALLNIGADVSSRIAADVADKVKKLAQLFSLAQLFAMGEVVKSTIKELRTLSLRDSRVLVRLMIVGLILAKEGKAAGAAPEKPSLLQLVSSGRTVELPSVDRIRAVFKTSEVVDLVQRGDTQ